MDNDSILASGDYDVTPLRKLPLARFVVDLLLEAEQAYAIEYVRPAEYRWAGSLHEKWLNRLRYLRRELQDRASDEIFRLASDGSGEST